MRSRQLLLMRLLILVVPLGLLASGASVAQASTFTVNTTDDGGDAVPNGICETAPGNGVCTLRAALQEANGSPALDTIRFSIPTSDPGYNSGTCSVFPPPGTGSTGTFLILVVSAYPTISNPVIIDGTTQTGFAGSPLIEVNGQN